jgi:chloride channel protein, CIC family
VKFTAAALTQPPQPTTHNSEGASPAPIQSYPQSTSQSSNPSLEPPIREPSQQPNLTQPDLPPVFWLLVVLTGVAAGVASGLLMRLLRFVERTTYNANAGSFLADVLHSSPHRRIVAMALAGLITGCVIAVLHRLRTRQDTSPEQDASSQADRHPPNILHALLSIVTVGMGAPLGREAALKEVAAFIGTRFASTFRLTPAQRQLLIACGAGAGMAAAYNVPFGGAVFAVEVLLGTISMQTVTAALVTSCVSTATSWLFLPNLPAYTVPTFHLTASILYFSLLAAPLFGIASAAFVSCIAWASRAHPRGWWMWVAPVLVLTSVGIASTAFPELLGNGKDTIQNNFLGIDSIRTLSFLLLLRPVATIASFRSGAVGGLFTPTMSLGAILGSLLGALWLRLPIPAMHNQPSATTDPVYSLIGSGAILAAATQAPVSSLIFVLELTHHADALTIPLLLAMAGAILTHRFFQPGTIYSVRD